MSATTTHHFSLPLPPPTVNQLLSRHPASRSKLKRAFYDAVALTCRSEDIPKASSHKRRVCLTILLGPRKRGADPDAYFKVTLDALVECGRLVNDSGHWVELAPVVFQRGPCDGCEITLVDL